MSVSTLFPKGQSGNPGGTTSEHKRLAIDFKYECARQASKRIPVLLEIIDNHLTPPNIRIMALNSLFDRGYGKAIQSVIVDNDADKKDARMLTKAEMDMYVAHDAVALAISMVKRQEPALLEAIKEISNPDKTIDKPAETSINNDCFNKTDDHLLQSPPLILDDVQDHEQKDKSK